MLLAGMFETLVGWIFRVVVVKFVAFTGLFALMEMLIPKMLEMASSFLGTISITSAMSSIPAGVWFFVDFFAIDVGLPLVISAYVTRFLIRRIPVIG